ncbi:MAG: sugar phosphate nucleotidyltransferase [Candidatus Peregrinibacteria bacterium]
MIKKAVILAAGLGTRFLPVTKSIPKEMLPIGTKPCIQYLVEEAIKSGIKEIIIVTNKNKPSIKEYFTSNTTLYKTLKTKKKNSELKQLKDLDKLNIKFAYQPSQLGDGHAILCAKHLIAKEPIAVLFGDDIYDSTIPTLKQMLALYNKVKSPVIGLTRIQKKDSKKYGIIAPKNSKGKIHEIQALIEKPTPNNAPSNLAIVGKYIITPELLNSLSKTKSHTKDKELRLIDGMIALLKKGKPIFGLELSGKRFDTGEKNGYMEAVKHFA